MPTPPSTARPTTEFIKTMEYSTQSSSTTSTKSSTTDIPTSKFPSRNPVTTERNEYSTISTTIQPTTTVITETTTKEKYYSTQEPTTFQQQTTNEDVTTKQRITTTMLPTTNVETSTTERTTTEQPTTTPLTTTTEVSTTEEITTTLPSTTASTTVATLPTTKNPRPGPSVCSKSHSKDILFIIDGTYNYGRHRQTRKREWNQVKHFVKEIVSELNDDKFRIGIMIYGGRREPRVEVDLWVGDNTAHVLSKIDNIRQVRGRERNTGESLTIAAAKVSYHYFIYGRIEFIPVTIGSLIY